MNEIATGSVRRLATATVLVSVLLILCGSGCRKETPKTPDSNTPAGGQAVGPNDVTKPRPDKIMASVNGTPIMESQVMRRVAVRYKPQLDKLSAQSPQMAAQWEKQAVQLATNELVIEQLLEKEAKQAGIEVTEEQLMTDIATQLAAEKPPLTVEQYRKMIEDQGIDFAAWKDYYIRYMTCTKFLESRVGATVQVTEEEAQKYYDENPDDFKMPEQVRASHILISTQATDPNADPNQVKAQAREKAEKLLKQVKEGADFATVAKENSVCPSAAQGGELPPFGRGQMVPPFEEAAFALKVGEISELVETQFGYHIIKVAEHQDPNTVTFATAKDRIMERLKNKKMEDAFGSYIQALQQKAAITYASGDMTPPMRPPAAASEADADQAPAESTPVAPADPNADPNKA
ncbi:MAG: peptidylprolyl isomerase [Phycisphaerales bacterium]